MGLTREEALKILRLSEAHATHGSLYKYRKLAKKYHPDRHPGRNTLAKFQRVVAAYVRLHIEPDDCDEMKLKHILAELYSINEELTAPRHVHFVNRWSDTDSIDSDDGGRYPVSGGPYGEVLQDFMIRSYMPVGRKSKPTVNADISRTNYVTEAARERALLKADELVKAEEEGKKKDEKRKQRNKRKKEAKKRKKQGLNEAGKSSGKSTAKATGASKAVENYQEAEEEDDLEDNDELDMTSAFFARLMSNKSSTTAQSKGLTTQTSSSSNSSFTHETNSKCSPSVERRSFNKESQSIVFKEETAHNSNDEVAQTSGDDYFNGDRECYTGQNGDTSDEDDGGYGGGDEYWEDEVTSEPIETVQSITNKKIENSLFGVVELSGEKIPDTVPNLEGSRKKAVIGNRAAKEGRFQDAILNFTEAINLYPSDHRYYGNRSFCYDYLHHYNRALVDADKALQLQPDWPKGYFRKGRALAGLKQYQLAQKSYQKALQLDPKYSDAIEELKKLKVDEIMNMGFDETTSQEALAQFGSVKAAIDGLLAGKLSSKPTSKKSPRSAAGVSKDSVVSKEASPQPVAPQWSHRANLPPRLQHLANPFSQCRSLWVGNITGSNITEDKLLKLFQRVGPVDSVRLLPERFCAFVNYEKPEDAAQAIKQLQDHNLSGCELIIRYPDNVQSTSQQSISHSFSKSPGTDRRTGPVNGDECFFWRTNGCHFGDSCRYRHIPKHQGIDQNEEGIVMPRRKF